MKTLLLIAACMGGFLYSHAQKLIKGKVTDAGSNIPLAGANILYPGKGGTSTDTEGTFYIPCGTARITVSFLGYETFHQAIKNCDQELVIRLSPSSSALNEVEITATSNPNKSLLYQPSAITKLNHTELKRGTGLFLDDAINTNVPGVIMQRRSISGGQQFNIRGYGNGTRGTAGVSSNFDIQGTKVYLNGIPLTDAEGITVLDDIDFGSVGSTEVLKGPSGTLFGLAIAGVVNLNTIRPEKDKVSVGQDVMAGSYGLRRYTTHFQWGGEHASLLVNYGHQESDGFMVHTASHKDFINVSGEFQPSTRHTVSTYFGYSNSYDQRAGELTIGQYDALNYSGNPVYIKNNAHSEIISFRAGLNHTWRFSNRLSNSTTLFGSGATNNSSSAAGWTDKDPINYGLRSTMDARFSLGKNLALNGITGVETQGQRGQTIGYAMVADSNNLAGYNRIGAMRSNQYTLTATTSVFTEWTLSLPRELFLTAGIGLSQMHIELNDRFYVASAARFPTRYAQHYKNMYSPHLAINKVFSRQLSAYASYSRGYKAPVSSYFFIPSTGQLNTGLKPEKGDQFEIGTKGSLLKDRLSYQLALFQTVFSDKMTAVPGPQNLYSYVVNGGSQKHRGLEFQAHYLAYQSGTGFFTTISPFGNFTYSDFNYVDFRIQRIVSGGVKTEDYSGKPVAGVAPVTANFGLDLTTLPGLYLNACYSYRDALPISSDGLNKTKSYSLLHAKLGFRRSFSKHVDAEAFFGANNITGTQYYLMVFVNQLPDAYLPAPNKINYFGGLNLKYNF